MHIKSRICLNDGMNTDDKKSIHKSVINVFTITGDVRLQVCKKSPCDILQGELVGSGYMPANNKNQRKAIMRALVEPFSLIQGPPGT